jgi:hypothetical protein
MVMVKNKFKTIRTLLFISTFFILNSIFYIAHATIRYVSTTGSSTPPYTSWETAADSIQKCINFSVAGDTIIVANGIYKERLKIDRFITLIGLSADSTVIDGRGLIGNGLDSLMTISVYDKFEMKNIHVYGHTGNIIFSWEGNGMDIRDCMIEHGANAIAFGRLGENYAENLIIKNVEIGIHAGDFTNTAVYYTLNNLIVTEARWGLGIGHAGSGTHIITNNIIIHTNPEVVTEAGILMDFIGKAIIKNNIVAGFQWNHFWAYSPTQDSVIIINNLFGYSSYDDPLGPIVRLADGTKKVFKNNMVIGSRTGVGLGVNNNTLTPDYNLYWDLQSRYEGYVIPGQNEMTANPMLVNDTIPDSGLNFDYHLQAHSPGIDAGDPEILDVDGTRSDIGPYGGPLGEKYTYQDLAPRPPVNLTAEMDSIAITLSWNRNTEADFSYYRIYRDTVTGFNIDSTKLISSQADTFYVQLIHDVVKRFVYKLTALDSQGNASGPSEELIVNITSTGEYPVTISDYILYQNYPNPFNPSTKIGFKLKERGYVKLMVYDIKGELVDVLVNDVKDAGYYETEFGRGLTRLPDEQVHQTQQNELASGIYIYRIEVIGKGNIPRFVDMGKMILLK